MMTVGRITQLTTDKGPLPKRITALPPVRSDLLFTVVNRIVDELFLDGCGRPTLRLAHKHAGATGEVEGGGWCRGAVRDIILKHLKANAASEARRGDDHGN